MKKILSLLLIFSTLLVNISLSSCKEKTPAEEIAEAIENTLALSELSVSVKEKVKQSFLDTHQTASSSFEIRINDMNGPKMDYSAEISAESLGIAHTVNLYYRANTYFLKMGGQKIKKAADKDSIAYDMPGLIKKLLTVPTKECFSENPIVDGKTALTFEEEDFYSVFGQYVDSAVINFLPMMVEDSLKVENGKVEYTLKDGYITAVDISCDISMQIVYGEQFTDLVINLSDSLIINSPGEDVKVLIPDDLDKYKESN